MQSHFRPLSRREVRSSRGRFRGLGWAQLVSNLMGLNDGSECQHVKYFVVLRLVIGSIGMKFM